jgi:hypothetical protein
VIVYALLFLVPGHATVIAWAFAAAVAVTAGQRIVAGLRLLRAPAPAGQSAGRSEGGSRPSPVPVPRRGTAA